LSGPRALRTNGRVATQAGVSCAALANATKASFTPRARRSGERIRLGSITPGLAALSSCARLALIEAARLSPRNQA